MAKTSATAHPGQVVQEIQIENRKIWIPLDLREWEQLCGSLGGAAQASDWLQKQALEVSDWEDAEMVLYVQDCVRKVKTG
ncbi:hypothetical protein JKG47_07875 [Acidithiobacillus sp. MC6.1]|nr:hypothetical protein [Acidithiobacillus sp. MC6.1]